MLSKIPVDLAKVKGEEIDRQIIRAGMIAELDAINLYEQLAALAKDDGLKKVLQDIADEEKTHLGEFLALLLKKDGKQVEELKKGSAEVEELTG